MTTRGGAVTLSEHEQRQLEAIERALYADDPKFSRAVRYTDPKIHGRRRIISGGVLVAVGLGVLLAGAVLSLWYVGVVGFLIMLLGATRAYGGFRRLTGGRPGGAGPAGPDGRSVASPRGPRGRAPWKGLRAGLVERFEERWHRRFDSE